MGRRTNYRDNVRPGQKSVLAYVFLALIAISATFLLYPATPHIRINNGRRFVRVNEIKSDMELFELIIRQFKEQYNLCREAKLIEKGNGTRLIVDWVLLENDFSRRYTRDSLLKGDKFLVGKFKGIKSFNTLEVRVYRQRINKSNLISSLVFRNSDVQKIDWSVISTVDLLAGCSEGWIEPTLQ